MSLHAIYAVVCWVCLAVSYVLYRTGKVPQERTLPVIGAAMSFLLGLYYTVMALWWD